MIFVLFVNLVVFSEALRREVRHSGVNIQALCPGLTGTEFHRFLGKESDDLRTMFWMSADQVVDVSLCALSTHRVIVISGLLNRMSAALLQIPS